MDEIRRQKIDLVWAAVILSAMSTVALTLVLSFSAIRGLDAVTAIVLVVGWTLSALAAVLLLTVPGEAKVLVLAGRVVVCLAFLTLALGGGLAILSIAGVG